MLSVVSLRLQHTRNRLAEISRVHLWWENKLCPILAAIYATALTVDVSLASLWSTLVAVAVAIRAQAVFTSVINDLTDRETDRRAGKDDRLAGQSRLLAAAVLWTPIAAGVAFAVWWRRDPAIVAVYTAGCPVLYSLPPFRLKERGLGGVLADACGAHLFPTLLGVLLVYSVTGRELDRGWVLLVGSWALACGLRNALCHQVSDRLNDLRIGLGTFAARYPPERAVTLGTFVIFPLELIALALVLWRLAHPLPVVALAAYAVLTFLRHRLWGLGVVIVEPTPRAYVALHSYYEAFFPISLLFVSAARYPLDVLVLVAHLALFRRPAAEAVLNAWTMIKMPVGRLLRSRV